MSTRENDMEGREERKRERERERRTTKEEVGEAGRRATVDVNRRDSGSTCTILQLWK